MLETEPTGLLDGGNAPGVADGGIVGGGILLSVDSRSGVVYPRSGSLHQLRVAGFPRFLGSSYEFATISVDLRKYLSPLPTHVLALRALGQFTTGAPPFDRLPEIGGDVLMRGYYQGRFRDRNLIALQVEYRAPVFWRIGVVGFGAAGQVAGRLDDFGLRRFKASAGGGLRFLLSRQEGLNVRADFAYGFDVKSTGFYLSIGEAF